MRTAGRVVELGKRIRAAGLCERLLGSSQQKA
jgi:hypothetical protein